MTSNSKIPLILIEQLKKGDYNAFEQIYRLMGGKIYNFVLKLIHDKYLAEEILQDFFLKLWEMRENIDLSLNFESYLFTIARHMVFKTTKDILNEQNILYPLEEAKDYYIINTESDIDIKIVNDYIMNKIEQLPPMCRTIYKMSRFEHLSNEEISKKMNISRRTVETHIYNALKSLKATIGNNIIIAALAYFFG